MDHAWLDLPATRDAARNGQYGTLLRLARTAAGLTLAQAGKKAGYSAATLSRMETGRQQITDVTVLRRLATTFNIPPGLFGLTDSGGAVGVGTSTTPAKVSQSSPNREEGEDLMRRRDLLAGSLTAALGPALGAPLEATIFGHAQPPPAGTGALLTQQVSDARTDLLACRYVQLSRRLPALIAAAVANRQDAKPEAIAYADGWVAQVYTIATRLLIKLHDDAMAWSTADRAVQAATACQDPLILAQARQTATIVMRRTRHDDGAQTLIVDTAQQLRVDTGLVNQSQRSLYAELLATAAYTAALRSDRDTAGTLMGEADRAGGSLTRVPFGGPELTGYKISVARALGDYGTAVDYARGVNPTRLASVDRQARYWEDTALSLHGRGRPAQAFRVLLAAEQGAPQEVRYRPWAQALTTDLLRKPGPALPGIRELAGRIGVPA